MSFALPSSTSPRAPSDSLQPLGPAPTVTGSGRATRRDVNPHANTMSGIHRGFLPRPTLRPSPSSQKTLCRVDGSPRDPLVSTPRSERSARWLPPLGLPQRGRALPPARLAAVGGGAAAPVRVRVRVRVRVGFGVGFGFSLGLGLGVGVGVGVGVGLRLVFGPGLVLGLGLGLGIGLGIG